MTTPSISFKNDYSMSAHPGLLEAVVATSGTPFAGYQQDTLSDTARQTIRQVIGNPAAEVFFLSGGTQTNLCALGHMLRPHEAVIAVSSGHIAVHEAGAIEATGHKVITVPGVQSKVTPRDVSTTMSAVDSPHTVVPGLVYISNPTELGACYSLSELEDLRTVCREHNLVLYMDGARLPMALAGDGASDVAWADLGRLVDAFYIGGTKCGFLFGEALVFNDPRRANFMATYLKQRGALLAKGWLIAAQFQAFFERDLHLQLARHANHAAREIALAFGEKNVALDLPCSSNQVFAVLPEHWADRLAKEFTFYRWPSSSSDAQHDSTYTTIRLVTSWATTQQDLEAIIALIQQLD